MALKVESEKNSSQLARHRVKGDIQTMIIEGQYKPGEKLIQQKLARKLGVGQGVVREALLELQMSGLVETIDNRGVFVGELSAQTLLEAYYVREMHEGLAVRLCCDHMTRAEIRELKELARTMCDKGVSGERQEMGQLDRRFHNQIILKSGNVLLERLAESYSILQKVVHINHDPQEVYNDHVAILDAVEAGEADTAEKLMRAHIAKGRRVLEEQISNNCFHPDWVRTE